jgi:hypothetical protein
MQKQPTKLDILLACAFGAIMGAGLALIFIYRTGWGI